MTTHQQPAVRADRARQDLRRPARRRRGRPRGAPRRGLRRPRPQRRRQDHDAQDARHPASRSTAAPARSSATTYGDEPHLVRQLIGVTGQFASVDENLTATENLWLFARLQGLGRTEARARGAHLLEQFDLTEAAQQADLGLLRRHAPPARPRREPDHPAAADLPRRAHHRARPAHPRPDVGHHPRARRRGQHRPADHAVPRRGRPAGRPHRGDRPRPQGRRGHRRRAQVVGRVARPSSSSSSTSTTSPPRRARRAAAGRGPGPHARSPAGSTSRSSAPTSPSTYSWRCATAASRSSR